MDEYHVACGALAIYAGKLNEDKTAWLDKTECTEEAVEAVRDYFVMQANAEGTKEYGFAWTHKDGYIVELTVRKVDEPKTGDK